MATYEDLKIELLEIAKVIEKFPVEVKPKVYELLVSTYLGKRASAGEQPAAMKGSVTTNALVESTRKPSKKVALKESYSIDRDLNLRGDEKDIPPFRKFVDEKKPASAQEFNTVSVYYLKKLMNLPATTLNHVYTCYAEAKKKPPEHFKQSLTDTKNKLGYIGMDSNGNLDIPHRGVVFVEHDLPVQKKEKE
jgi:hypothetical protein